MSEATWTILPRLRAIIPGAPPATRERRGQVGGDDLVPLLLRKIGEGPATLDARVVEQDVDRALPGGRPPRRPSRSRRDRSHRTPLSIQAGLARSASARPRRELPACAHSAHASRRRAPAPARSRSPGRGRRRLPAPLFLKDRTVVPYGLVEWKAPLWRTSQRRARCAIFALPHDSSGVACSCQTHRAHIRSREGP